jgi:hypothetical protein
MVKIKRGRATKRARRADTASTVTTGRSLRLVGGQAPVDSVACESKRLAPEDLAVLEERGLSAEFVQQRGYYTAESPDELPELDAGEWTLAQKARMPSLAIPCPTPGGETTYQLRPRMPRYSSKGRKVKYETPSRLPEPRAYLPGAIAVSWGLASDQAARSSS